LLAPQELDAYDILNTLARATGERLLAPPVNAQSSSPSAMKEIASL